MTATLSARHHFRIYEHLLSIIPNIHADVQPFFSLDDGKEIYVEQNGYFSVDSDDF